MGSSSFHMFIYGRSEQCDLGPIYTITNTQRIRIYPGKLKFILGKISPDPGRLHGNHAKENQTLLCMIKIFRGGGEGVVDGEGGSSERCLKWGGGGH